MLLEYDMLRHIVEEFRLCLVTEEPIDEIDPGNGVCFTDTSVNI